MLLRWLNAAESTQRFTYRGERRWLRPDGYAEFKLGGKIHRFFLEWDRGTTRHSDRLDEKFKNYANYFAVLDANDRPDLLVVTVSSHREAAIWNNLRVAFGDRPPGNVRTTIDSLVGQSGAIAAIWRSSDSPHRNLMAFGVLRMRR
jgi:hypothetical protein